MKQSMSRVAKCINNGPMEGFWGILKRERYYGRRFTSREELVNMIELLQQPPGTAQPGRADADGEARQLSFGSIKNFRQPKAGSPEARIHYFISLST